MGVHRGKQGLQPAGHPAKSALLRCKLAADADPGQEREPLPLRNRVLAQQRPVEIRARLRGQLSRRNAQDRHPSFPRTGCCVEELKLEVAVGGMKRGGGGQLRCVGAMSGVQGDRLVQAEALASVSPALRKHQHLCREVRVLADARGMVVGLVDHEPVVRRLGRQHAERLQGGLGHLLRDAGQQIGEVVDRLVDVLAQRIRQQQRREAEHLAKIHLGFVAQRYRRGRGGDGLVIPDQNQLWIRAEDRVDQLVQLVQHCAPVLQVHQLVHRPDGDLPDGGHEALDRRRICEELLAEPSGHRRLVDVRRALQLRRTRDSHGAPSNGGLGPVGIRREGPVPDSFALRRFDALSRSSAARWRGPG
mmetsp:Transcript_1629/g.7110  ORF Transcript_1629/g.7110 Transcript_1629/m.7110 type:complete len:361 (+) Transcript_1629:1039-2121(+)|eukprot:scaffold1655_cov247-Pinguiococcus_pyrenoidosus.AAC.10